MQGPYPDEKRSGVGGFHTQSQTQAQKTKTHTHTDRRTQTQTHKRSQATGLASRQAQTPQARKAGKAAGLYPALQGMCFVLKAGFYIPSGCAEGLGLKMVEGYSLEAQSFGSVWPFARRFRFRVLQCLRTQDSGPELRSFKNV